MNKLHEAKKSKFSDPLLPASWASVRLARISSTMTAWCSEQQLELGRDYMLHTQEEEVWIICDSPSPQEEPLEFRTTQPFHYFFFKNPVNATAFVLKFYENRNF